MGPGSDAAVPYPPSALNRLFARVEGLPGGGWWVYPLAYVALVAYHHVALWMIGSVPVGSLSLDGVPGIMYGPYGLGAMHVIFRLAGPTMDTFRPASGLSDEAFARRRYELVTLRPGRIIVPLAIGVIVAVASLLSAPPDSLVPYGGTRGAAFLVLGPAAIFGYAVSLLSIYATGHVLVMIHRLHLDATALDPFDTAPIFAFSRVTSLVGVLYVFSAYYTFLFNAAFQVGNAIGIAMLAGIILMGTASFIVPLWSIHGRLADEKAILERGASQRARALQEDLYRRVDAGNVAGIKDLTDAAAGIHAASDRIARLPTWPWPPQVLRGFLSAILLPVIVFLITRYVGSQIP